ncbi:peptidase M14 [bacterium]|nr:peptidase M14 [bacterium]
MRRLSALALGAFLLAGNAPEPVAPRVALEFSRYYDVGELAAALQELAAAYPEFLDLGTMGKSRGGNDMWIMTVTDKSTGKASGKPAMYIDANTHGNEIQGGEVALFTINYLVTRQATDPWVRELMENFAFYIAPTVNPDSRHRFFTEPNSPHSPRQNTRPFDNDRDGLVDEDGPEDIDGDGEILQMRRADPYGSMVDGSDPRSMRRRRPGEQGQWRFYRSEGIDNDGDGRINEDGTGGVDLNRQFPWQWEPDNIQRGAGPYMLSEPESRNTVEFIRAHPNIAGVQSYHNAGDMILRPPGAMSASDARLPRSDLAVMDGLAKLGENFLPDYRYLEVYGGLYPVHGGFFDWTYGELGIFSFTNELYSLNPDYDGDGRTSQEERLRWNDEVAHGGCFVDWKPFDHPQLGPVEIGGWRAFCTRAPLPDDLPEMALRNTLFTLLHASFMPRVGWGEVVAERVERGLWRLEVEVVNNGHMPTASGQARRVGSHRPDMVAVEGGTLLAGGRLEDVREVADPAERLLGGMLAISNLGAQESRRLVLLVAAKAGDLLVLRLTSQKGGEATTTVRLPGGGIPGT